MFGQSGDGLPTTRVPFFPRPFAVEKHVLAHSFCCCLVAVKHSQTCVLWCVFREYPLGLLEQQVLRMFMVCFCVCPAIAVCGLCTYGRGAMCVWPPRTSHVPLVLCFGMCGVLLRTVLSAGFANAAGVFGLGVGWLLSMIGPCGLCHCVF